MEGTEMHTAHIYYSKEDLLEKKKLKTQKKK